MAVHSADNVYVLVTPSKVVLKVTPAGAMSIVVGNGYIGLSVPGPATSSPLRAPRSIALDSNDNLYISDAFENRILKVTPGGTLS